MSSFHLEHHFKTIPIDTLRSFYEDLAKITDVHPLVVKVERLSSPAELQLGTESELPFPTSTTTKQGPSFQKAYRITDSIPILPFLPNHTLVYETVCVLDAPTSPTKDLSFYVFPNTSVRMLNRYKFRQDESGQGCYLSEDVEVTARTWFGGWLTGLTASQAEKAHRETFRKLEEKYKVSE